MERVAVIDYGGSNLRSVVKAIEFVADRQQVVVTNKATDIQNADRVVFPGQGAIEHCMTSLAKQNLLDAIGEVIQTRPFLGICLGLQSLLARSDEDGGTQCLGIYPGEVVRFPDNPPAAADGSPQKIPHMGWNQVDWARTHPVVAGIDKGSRFYFVHSYFVRPQDTALTMGTTDYIEPFVSAIAHGFVFATQFHPEKSADQGLHLLRNFLAWQPDGA